MADKQDSSRPTQNALPPQVEKMLASAKEMEAVLSKKLTEIDAISKEKSEMAKQEALKIKADVEEIKRLSLIQTKEGDEALKVKIQDVNQKIEMTTRKAAELQTQLVQCHKQLYDEVSVKGAEVKKAINAIPGLPESERIRLNTAVDTMLGQAKGRWQEMKESEEKMKQTQEKMKTGKPDKNVSKEDVMKKLEEQLATILDSKKEDDLNGPNTFKAAPRK